MSFVDHEHADFAGDWIKRLIEKGFIGEAFGRNQQSIDFAGKKPGTNILPHFTVLLFGSDAGCAHAHPFSGGDLIADEGEER